MSVEEHGQPQHDSGSSSGATGPLSGAEVQRGLRRAQFESLLERDLDEITLRVHDAGWVLEEVTRRRTGRGPGRPPEEEAVLTSVERAAPGLTGALWALVTAAAVTALLLVALASVAGCGESTTPSRLGHRNGPVLRARHPEATLLLQARALARADIDTAHALLTKLDEDSPAWTDFRCVAIESDWADALLARAATAGGVEEVRHWLVEIVLTPSVDTERRERAAETLRQTEGDARSALTGGKGSARRSKARRSRRSATRPRGAITSSSRAPERSASKPDWRQVKYDERTQRRWLEWLMDSRRASARHVRMLRAICSNQGDHVCRNRATRMLRLAAERRARRRAAAAEVGPKPLRS